MLTSHRALAQALNRIKTLEKDKEELVDIVRSLATTSKASWQVRDCAINVLTKVFSLVESHSQGTRLTNADRTPQMGYTSNNKVLKCSKRSK